MADPVITPTLITGALAVASGLFGRQKIKAGTFTGIDEYGCKYGGRINPADTSRCRKRRQKELEDETAAFSEFAAALPGVSARMALGIQPTEEEARAAQEAAAVAIIGGTAARGQARRAAGVRSASRAMVVRSEVMRARRRAALKLAAIRAREWVKAFGKTLGGRLGGAAGVGEILKGRIPYIVGFEMARQTMEAVGDVYARRRVAQIQASQAKLSRSSLERLKRGPVAAPAREVLRLSGTRGRAGARARARALASRQKVPAAAQEAALKQIKLPGGPAAPAIAPQPSLTPPGPPASRAVTRRPAAGPSGIPGFGQPRPSGITWPSLQTASDLAMAAALHRVLARQPAGQVISMRAPAALAQAQPAGAGAGAPPGAVKKTDRCQCKPCKGERKRRTGKRVARRRTKCLFRIAA